MERLTTFYDACLAGGSPIALECTLQTRFGEERTAQVSANGSVTKRRTFSS
jgi:hypothetical protein